MKDFRVRAFLYFENEGVALGLYDHVLDVKGEAVDINPNSPNVEMRLVEIGDNWVVDYDLAFSPDKKGIAQGLFNHTKNIPTVKLPNPENGEETGFVSIEQCGHRTKQRCDIIERYDVE